MIGICYLFFGILQTMAVILVRDKDGVLNVWKMHKKPCFAIYQEQGNKLLFGCVEEDEEDREKELVKYLDIMQSSMSGARFCIQFYDRADFKNKITTSTPSFGSLPFSLADSDDGAGGLVRSGKVGAATPTNLTLDLMDKLYQERMNRIEDKYETRLAEIQRLHEEEMREMEEQEDPAEESEMLGKIGAIGEKYPWLQEHIKDGITIAKSLLNKFTGNIMNTNPSPGIAGAPTGATPQEKHQWAMKTLLTYYHGKYGGQEQGDINFSNDMERLANMAVNDADLFDVMIKKLRAAS
jgi:hypothetical protein